MIIGKDAGLDVITIAHKDLWGQFIPPPFLDCGYCCLVFPDLINTKPSWSVQWSDIPSGLLSSHSFFFFFRIKCFSVDGEIAHRTTSWRRAIGPRAGGHPSGIQSYRCSQPLYWVQTLYVATSLEIRRYYFPLLFLYYLLENSFFFSNKEFFHFL
jgi:hypothetical protein